ncbi:hypothetical protein SAMN05421805_12413 [Saccharopolyspora antimicrobica]|uniref:Uncharacterized protein n=1 Tax=Saccharopolyspora antimicrobica TaxID=455193 RepID=A0A1I5JTC3_9PSEU|nr:hypothetical protein [Saccharopolyspora antimicrobica]RKT86929.1 hypothetical protein ATL45_5311 [Saccharopolyspora antimicrobica]SFO76072.1 hypothetical protein SAMN05421805_12413 [Saccharopolyspora antimicrobica]
MISGSSVEGEFDRLFHLMEELKEVERRSRELLAEVIQEIQSLAGRLVGPRAIKPEDVGEGTSADESSVEESSAEESPAEESLAEEDAVASDDTRDLRDGEKRMIRVLSRHPKLTRTQLATLSLLKATSGTFSSYLSRLRSRELISIDGGYVSLTGRGCRSAGVRSVKPMPEGEVRREWLAVLRGGARRILEALIDVGSVGLTRDELAREAGLKATSGTYSAYLAKLRNNGLIEVVDGKIRITKILGWGT